MRSLKIRVQNYWIEEKRNGFTLTGLKRTSSEGRTFRLREVTPGVWKVNQNCSNGERRRRRFKAENLESAIQIAEAFLYFEVTELPANSLLIGDCFSEWLESRSCTQETKDRDYRPRINQFLKWIDHQGLSYWRDLRLHHLQTFANGLVESGKSSRTIELQCRVVKMASKWAALNWPEEFRDFAVGFKTPRQDRVVRYEDRGAKPFLRIAEVVDFVFWLRGQPSGFNILAGIALQGLCSLRVRETLRLTWDKVDIEKGTVTVDGRVKNIHSVRKIPVPRFVLDTLEETPIKGQRVLELLQDQDSYGRSFRRYLGRWRPQFKIEPKGLRRTLVSEFFEHGWYGDILQMYRGHKPSVSAIDWNHYISYRPEKIQEMFREQVVSKVDALVEEAIKQRPALPLSEKVVPLRNSA